MSATAPSLGVRRVHQLYDGLKADLHLVSEGPPADPSLSAEIAAVLAWEARLLDANAFERWLQAWDDDAVIWAPLRVDADPAADQSLFLDDRRRLKERVWRMRDPGAWALQPLGRATRVLGGVEAWSLEGQADVLASSALTLQYVRAPTLFSTIGRQIHRLRRTDEGWRMYRKIILLPAQALATPHLGWLL